MRAKTSRCAIALVKRSQQAAQLPVGTRIIRPTLDHARVLCGYRTSDSRLQSLLDEVARRRAQAFPHTRHTRSEIFDHHS